MNPSSVQLRARAYTECVGVTGDTQMKIEKPAKQRSDARKKRSKWFLFRLIFGLVRILGYVLLIIDKYWPKVVESCRELL